MHFTPKGNLGLIKQSSLLLPQLPTCTLSLWICLFWIFCRSGIMQHMAFCDWLLLLMFSRSQVKCYLLWGLSLASPGPECSSLLLISSWPSVAPDIILTIYASIWWSSIAFSKHRHRRAKNLILFSQKVVNKWMKEWMKDSCDTLLFPYLSLCPIMWPLVLVKPSMQLDSITHLLCDRSYPKHWVSCSGLEGQTFCPMASSS